MLCSCTIVSQDKTSSYSIVGRLSEGYVGTNSNVSFYVFGNRYLLNGITSPTFSINDVSVLASDTDTGENIVVILQVNYTGSVTAYVFIADSNDQHYYGITVAKVIETIHTLDKKYLPADIGMQADWNVTDENSPAYIKNKPRITDTSIILTDENDGLDYVIKTIYGNLVTMQLKGISHLEIASMPEKINYTEGEPVDLSGLSLNIVYDDGTKAQVTKYTTDVDIVKANTTAINVTVERYGEFISIAIPITVTAFDPSIVLIDFDYTTNDDGTYTIIGWKGTLNGVTSTELIVPDNSLIIV